MRGLTQHPSIAKTMGLGLGFLFLCACIAPSPPHVQSDSPQPDLLSPVVVDLRAMVTMSTSSSPERVRTAELAVRVGAGHALRRRGRPVPADAGDVTPAGGAAVCNSANAADGPDYSGEVQGNAIIRISDHYNGPGLNEAATVQDIPFPVNATCSNVASTSIGGTCNANTSANAAVPGAVKDTQRAVIEINQLQVNDGGADGQVATADNTLFEVQGIFIP